MKQHYLAPDVAVTLFRQSETLGSLEWLGDLSPVSLMAATMAVISVNTGAVAFSAEFELPSQRAQFDLCLGAIEIAYARGHMDRSRIMLGRLGFALVDQMPGASAR